MEALIKERLQPALERMAEPLNLKCSCSPNLGGTNSKITFWNSEIESQKLKITFQFAAGGSYIGFTYNPVPKNYPVPAIASKTAELFNDHYKARPRTDTHWCCRLDGAPYPIVGRDSIAKMYNGDDWVEWLGIKEKVQKMLDLFGKAYKSVPETPSR